MKQQNDPEVEMLREMIMALRIALGRAQMNYHAQSMQHGNRYHTGRDWLQCRDHVCQYAAAIWKEAKIYDLAPNVRRNVRRRKQAIKQGVAG